MADFFPFIYDCLCHAARWITIKSERQLTVATQTQVTTLLEEKRIYKENELDDVFKEIDELKTLKLYKRQKRHNRTKLKRTKNASPVVSAEKSKVPQVSRLPSKIALKGPIAHLNVNTVFETLRKDMRRNYINHRSDPKVLEKYARYVFDKKMENNQQDLAFVYTIQCHKAAEDILGSKCFYNKTNELLESMHLYNVQNRDLIECMVKYELFFKALSEKKYGEASELVSKVKCSLSSYQIGAWTGGVHELEGGLLNMLAFIWPQAKEDYYHNSYRCFEMAREHIIRHDNNMPGSYSWVYYLFQMQNCLLQLPMRKHLQFIVDSKRGKEFITENDTSMNDIEKAECLIQKARSEFHECDGKYAESFKYNITLAEIYLELRRAQLFHKQKKTEVALLAAERTLSQCDIFVGYIDKEEDAYYLSYARKWIEDIVKGYLYGLHDTLTSKLESNKSPKEDRDFRVYMKKQRKEMHQKDEGLLEQSMSTSSGSTNSDTIESDAVAS